MWKNLELLPVLWKVVSISKDSRGIFIRVIYRNMYCSFFFSLVGIGTMTIPNVGFNQAVYCVIVFVPKIALQLHYVAEVLFQLAFKRIYDGRGVKKGSNGIEDSVS